jgi:hypothetical protein
MPAIRRKSLVWLLLTFSPAEVHPRFQIAIDSKLGHPHLLLAGQNSWAPTFLKVCFLEM